jgi:hypothetical protein
MRWQHNVMQIALAIIGGIVILAALVGYFRSIWHATRGHTNAEESLGGGAQGDNSWGGSGHDGGHGGGDGGGHA